LIVFLNLCHTYGQNQWTGHLAHGLVYTLYVCLLLLICFTIKSK